MGVLGLGAMGRRMAIRLLERGHQVVVWNRSPEIIDELLGRGAEVALSPADLARRSQILITMVADERALSAVSVGADGLAAGASAGLVVVEMSTTGTKALLTLASFLPRGVALLDAPVLGSVAEAEAGQLLIFLGGEADSCQIVRPVLETLGSVMHMGGPGSGMKAKLLANAVLLNTICILGEALALGRAMGLSEGHVFQTLALTPLATQAEKKRRAIALGAYPKRFALRLARKDAGLIQEQWVAGELNLPLTAQTKAWFDRAKAAGLEDADYSAVIATICGHTVSTGGQTVSTAHSPGARSSAAAPDSRLSAIDFDGLILDLDGVVWRNGAAIPGAAEAISRLRRRGVRMVFLTNDSRRSCALGARVLSTMGIPTPEEDFVTSGTVAADVLRSLDQPITQVAVLGGDGLRAELAAGGFQLVALSSNNVADAVVVGTSEGLTYAELSAASQLVRQGALLVGTGRDGFYPTEIGMAPATGAILAAVEAASGVCALIAGKPEPSAFSVAVNRLKGCRRVAVVGDHLAVDIAGAKRSGLTALLVLSGVTDRGDLARAPVRPDATFSDLLELSTEVASQFGPRQR